MTIRRIEYEVPGQARHPRDALPGSARRRPGAVHRREGTQNCVSSAHPRGHLACIRDANSRLHDEEIYL
jgi:hypothetical protein